MEQKTITLSHTVIIPKDFTEFMKLSNVELRAVSYSMMLTINELEKDLIALQQASRPQDMGIEPAPSDSPAKVDKVKIAEDEVSANTSRKGVSTGNGGGNEGSTLGKKIGKTSKYHYVNEQMRNDKFYTFKASTTINKESVNMGSSKNEIQCALKADAYLDKIGDTKRSRNRDDFIEVMEAFIVKSEGEKVVAKVAKEPTTVVAGASLW